MTMLLCSSLRLSRPDTPRLVKRSWCFLGLDRPALEAGASTDICEMVSAILPRGADLTFTPSPAHTGQGSNLGMDLAENYLSLPFQWGYDPAPLHSD